MSIRELITKSTSFGEINDNNNFNIMSYFISLISPQLLYLDIACVYYF